MGRGKKPKNKEKKRRKAESRARVTKHAPVGQKMQISKEKQGF